LLILSARFTTVVRHDGLFIKYHPLHLKWRNIDLRTAIKVEAIAFSPLRDFGGWGIRFGSGGTAYTMNGNRGVRISYYRNQSIVIGSERPDELESAIRLVWKG